MAAGSVKKLGSFSAVVRPGGRFGRVASDSEQQKRELVAGFCRLVGAQFGAAPQSVSANQLPRRLRQTLARLLAGDSEKQIATALGISRHTVHVYVKALYRRFEVCSRGELLARFVSAPTVAQLE